MLNPIYFDTRFRVPNLPEKWPRRFVVITAHAKTGEIWTVEQNETAARSLDDWLERKQYWRWPITGYSPKTGHAEPGWAVALHLPQARTLGRLYQQDAIYAIRDDILLVTRCHQPIITEVVGSFRDRLDVVSFFDGG